MEIVKLGRNKLQIWHGSIDFWIQCVGTIIFGIGMFLAVAFSRLFPLHSLFFIAVGCGIGLGFLFLIHADQSLVSYCHFNRAKGTVEISRKFKIFQKSFVKIPLIEIASVELKTIQIQYQWLTLSLFNMSNIKFQWHNSNPVAAVLGFFTGKIILYQIALISQVGNEIPITCYETDVFRSKRKLVEQIAALLDSPSSQPQQKRDRAIAQWKRAIEIDNNNAEAHYQLGLALYRHKQRQEASIHLKRSRDLLAMQGDENKSARVQEELWQMGLE